MRGYKVTENGVDKIKLANKPLENVPVYYASKLSDIKQYYAQPQYTVVGSPIIIEGVVSGFSSTDYVQTLQQAPLSTDIIYVCKFKTEQSSTQQHILRLGNGHCAVYLYNNKICIEGSDENGAYFATAGVSTLSVGIYYFIKMVVSGTTVNISISADGVNYTTEITHGYSLAYQSPVILGSNHPYYLVGSIDLNNTYIKVNGDIWFRGNFPNWQE